MVVKPRYEYVVNSGCCESGLVCGGFVDAARTIVQDAKFVQFRCLFEVGSSFALICVWFIVFCGVYGVSVSDSVRSEVIIS